MAFVGLVVEAVQPQSVSEPTLLAAVVLGTVRLQQVRFREGRLLLDAPRSDAADRK